MHLTSRHASTYRCGVVVPPEQPTVFAQALLDLAQDAEPRYQMGDAARRYAEANLETDAVLGRFVDRLVTELRPHPVLAPQVE